jgi:hypothetical protein
MGFTPREIDEMTFAEVDACIEGWKRGNGAEETPEVMSDARHDALLAEARALGLCS